jgi:ATP-dependent RNA helicase DDX24/MAK5
MTADVGKKIKMLTYYILTVHGQGRTIVVCTSIAALRHISALLRILSIHVWKLHVQMQQRARLKVSDLFFFLLIILFKM